MVLSAFIHIKMQLCFNCAHNGSQQGIDYQLTEIFMLVLNDSLLFHSDLQKIRVCSSSYKKMFTLCTNSSIFSMARWA